MPHGCSSCEEVWGSHLFGCAHCCLHQNQDFVAREADENGVYSIGYHIVSEDMSSKYLTSVVCNWEILYGEIIKQYLQGDANKVKNFWVGLV